MDRKPIPKALRQQVYDKYQGHCAYCGKEITMKEMQVDHSIAIAKQYYSTRETMEKVRAMIADGTINDIDNLMPACRACNFYKGVNDIEGFRMHLQQTLSHTCYSSFQTRLAMQYGMITYKPWDGVFYFEKEHLKR